MTGRAGAIRLIFYVKTGISSAEIKWREWENIIVEVSIGNINIRRKDVEKMEKGAPGRMEIVSTKESIDTLLFSKTGRITGKHVGSRGLFEENERLIKDIELL